MGAVLIAAVCLAGTSLLLVGMVLAANDIPDLHDVFADDELVLGGRLIVVLNDEAERLAGEEPQC
ncbi:hypothetical protein [Streptosporangium sp. NPDC051022]|uniref:hypothetical protein n=1 Tax=Streptosporangium sp. NPDC051022 TaxID=3155752 RepID=UPI00342F5AFE